MSGCRGGGRRGRGSMAPTQQAPPGRGRCNKLSSELEHGPTLQTRQPSVARASQQKPETKTTVVQKQKPAASSKAVKFAPTLVYGAASTRCMIKANHFLVELSDRDLHHYDTSIAPEVTSEGLNRTVMRELLDKKGRTQFDGLKPAYDGRKGFYTAGVLPFTSKDFVVKLIDKDEYGSTILSLLSYLEEHEEDQVQMDQKCIVCQSSPCICSKEQLHSKDYGIHYRLLFKSNLTEDFFYRGAVPS